MKKTILFSVFSFCLVFTTFAQESMVDKQAVRKLRQLNVALQDAGIGIDEAKQSEILQIFKTGISKAQEMRSSADFDRSQLTELKKDTDIKISKVLTADQYKAYMTAKNQKGKKIEGMNNRPSNGSQGDKPKATKSDKLKKNKQTKEQKETFEETEVVDEEEILNAQMKEAEEKKKEYSKEKSKAKDQPKMDKPKKDKSKVDKPKMDKPKVDRGAAKEGRRQARNNAYKRISKMLERQGMPLSDTQSNDVKDVLKREAKKIQKLKDERGEGSKDFAKGVKKIKKGTVKKLKNILSKEQHKFLKSRWAK